MHTERTPLTEKQPVKQAEGTDWLKAPTFEMKEAGSAGEMGFKNWFQKEAKRGFQLPFSENKPCRILVVEDQLINRELIVRFLHRQECVIEVAENGQEAVDACRKKNYRLVLMDLQMPVMDGYEATRQIRNLKGIQQPSIVAVSAHASPEHLEMCRAVGMDGFVSKPIDFKKLKEVLREISGNTEKS